MDDLTAQYRRAVADFGTRVATIDPGQWAQPTPCAGWDVRQLVGHVASENAWVPPLVHGATIAEVGSDLDGDLLGSDPVEAWERLAAAALVAAHEDGVPERTVHVSFGDISGREYLSQVTVDHIVHGWDLAAAIGDSRPLDPDLVSFAWGYLEPRCEAWRAAGAFGPAVEVPDGAGTLDRLLGLTGRRP